QAARHHEGQEQADGDAAAVGAGRGARRLPAHHPPCRADRPQPGRDGQGRGRAGRHPEAEGIAVSPPTSSRQAGEPAQGRAQLRAPRASMEIAAMSKVLVIAEHLDGALNSSTARTVSAARALSPEAVDVAVFAADPSSVAAEAARIAGVARVLTVAGDANAHAVAQVLAPQVAALAGGY